MTNTPRLIEYAFPLKQASLDSVHEKNVRHGHIATPHIWPARRPLAACRAALIATLLPDPGTPEARQELCEKIGGKVVKKIERKKMPGGQVVEREKEETEGGILHWKRETENAETLAWFRQEIRKAYGGRAPKVLDPFAGGGAIPLEAMRLGCEATAIDINPVAWFILQCTLEYPQRLAGQKRPLPDFILQDRAFMGEFFKKAQGMGKAEIRSQLRKLGVAANEYQQSFDFDKTKDVNLEADLAWHVRAWGQWVLARARRDLAQFYPTHADFEPLAKDVKPYAKQPLRLVPLKEDGTPDIDALNAEFSADYLEVKSNPRWVAKPTAAYLWARTVTCRNCRATIPLLKTRWLCRKTNKRVLLTMEPKADCRGVEFGVETEVPIKGCNSAQRREHDKRIGAGTMSRAGVKCPCCGTIMTMEDIRVEGRSQHLGFQMTAVAVEGQKTKEQRPPTDVERNSAQFSRERIEHAFRDIPFGPVDEPMPSEDALGMRAPKYGINSWLMMFTPRQAVALASITAAARMATGALEQARYDTTWQEAISAYLACGLDRLVDFANVNVQWKVDADTINHALVRYAIQMTWDFAEGNPIGASAGAYILCINRIATALDTLRDLPRDCVPPHAGQQSAECDLPPVDVIITDPPYYDAVPYSDLMDWFYVWLRRHVFDLSDEYRSAMQQALGPKWNNEASCGELIADASRHGGNREASKKAYEDGMAKCFRRCACALSDNGRLVIVFANKSPDAWETLVAALIRAGFIVGGSWPIQTEQPSRMRGLASAALASSVWLVCKKRAATTRPGWDSAVLDEMRSNIRAKLCEFWNAGIRGPDFVWAATGPALEAYSKHPVVKKANEPGPMTVSEFLSHVRRMVVDFVVGRVLVGDGDEGGDASADRLDDPTLYYLLHRHDFGFEEAPAGTCTLYAVSCGLSDRELVDNWNLLSKSAGSTAAANGNDVDPDSATEADEGSGSKLKLKIWAQRKNRTLGYEAPGGGLVPLIDRLHRLMHLWRGGDVHKVDEYLDDHGLRRQELFGRLLQSLIELSAPGSDERSVLESLSNHIRAKGATTADPQRTMTFDSV